jgi:hypothetical protein
VILKWMTSDGDSCTPLADGLPYLLLSCSGEKLGGRVLLQGFGSHPLWTTLVPTDAAGWFPFLHTHRLIGLTFPNPFDAVNYAWVELIFLGLCAALIHVNKCAIALAMVLTFVAVAVHFASNQAFPMRSLSDQYVVATSDAQHSALLAAAEALLAIHNSGANYGNRPYVSFLFVNLAGLIIATAMLQSRAFGRASAITGTLANAFGLGYYVTLVLDSRLSFIPISAGALFLRMWYLLIGRKLLQLGWGAPNT